MHDNILYQAFIFNKTLFLIISVIKCDTNVSLKQLIL